MPNQNGYYIRYNCVLAILIGYFIIYLKIAPFMHFIMKNWNILCVCKYCVSLFAWYCVWH